MESIFKPAFNVPPIDESFDPNSEPSNGEEYLQKVLYERKKCPEIVVAKRKPCNQNTTIESNIETEDTERYSNFNFLATPEWQDMQIKEFMSIQNKVIDHRKKFVDSIDSVIELPCTTETDKWIEYCINNPPLLSIMMNINQRTLEELLEILSETLQEKENVDFSVTDKWLSQWIYANLACLRLPIEPSVHSVLRDIARNCIRLRDLLKDEDNVKLLPLNLFICIISNNFNQLDLSDHFM